MLYTTAPGTSSPIAARVGLEVRSQCQGRNSATIQLLASVDGAVESSTRMSVVQPEVLNADDALKRVITQQFAVRNRRVQVQQ